MSDQPSTPAAGSPGASRTLIRGVSNAKDALRGGAVAIGNFDGLHRGHQALFHAAKEEAAALGRASGVLTFEPHPVQLLAPHFAPPLILTFEEKVDGVFANGIDVVVVEPFDLTFAALSPEVFVRNVLVTGLGIRTVIVGEDFSFGNRGAGSVDTLRDVLRESSPEGNAKVRVVPAVQEGNLVCSSTKVREFILAGRMDAARIVLGHPYWMRGEVVRGDGRGRTIDVPTANLECTRALLPKVGVYATRTTLEDGRVLPSVTNVGLRPTFAEETPNNVRVETHLLDFNEDLYRKTITVSFIGRLRDEKKFAGREALVDQIRADLEHAKRVLAAN